MKYPEMQLRLPITLWLATFTSNLLEGEGLPQNNRPTIAGNRQVGVGGLSFAIPALNLLGGGNNAGIGGNGLFGAATVTRTLVSTVATVTTASFRTCIAPTNQLAATPCVPGAAGRRKRDLSRAVNNPGQNIEATPTMHLIIGATTISDPTAVTEYLEAHKPSTQSVIYPKDIVPPNSENLKINPRFNDMNIEQSTFLYPSQDTPDATESQNSDVGGGLVDDEESSKTTTETPILQECLVSEVVADTPAEEDEANDDYNDIGDKARRGLGKTTTVTTIIRVTSVATSLATGMQATLTVSYAGCLPPSLPISGMPCPN